MIKSIIDFTPRNTLKVISNTEARKSYLKGISNAEKFWNLLVITAFIVFSLIASIEVNLVLQAFLSVVVIVYALDPAKTTSDLWVFISLYFWFVIILVIGLVICKWIYDNTIVKFNNWLNKL